jgi:DNA polymerase III subunit delta'
MFSKVIAQQNIKQHLQDLLNNNRLSHALLFVGKEGSGALPLALAFAQQIVCKPPEKVIVEDLFGRLSSLPTHNDNNEQQHAAQQRALQLIHPDLHFSFPVIARKPGEKPTSDMFIGDFREFIKQSPYSNVYDWLQMIGADNKQGNISAEECHEIIKKLSLKCYEADNKVLLMWMPEYLGKSGNKLLKIIEEPPPNTIFILVAENEEQILPTIISRCQLIRVPQLSTNNIKQALIERANANETQANQIASIAEGNYREALQMMQHNQEDWQTIAKEWLRVVLRKLLPDQVKWIDEISKIGREKQKQFLKYFNHLLQQSIRIKILGIENVHLPEEEIDFAQRINKIASVSQLEVLIEEIDKAAYHIERNANGKILFHALSIKLYHIIQNKILIEV